MKKGIIIFVLTALAISGCSKNEKPECHDCDDTVLIDKLLYDNTPTNNYVISAATIKGDCLELNFGASGCDGRSWVVKLVDAQAVAETGVPKRFIKLSLVNNELCTAAFGRTVSFDIKPLRVNGINQISLELAGLNSTLVYSY